MRAADGAFSPMPITFIRRFHFHVDSLMFHSPFSAPLSSVADAAAAGCWPLIVHQFSFLLRLRQAFMLSLFS